MTKPDYKSFAREIIEGDGGDWGGDWDGGSIQDLAVKHGIIRKVQYNPEVHPNYVGAEPGDPWCEFVELPEPEA